MAAITTDQQPSTERRPIKWHTLWVALNRSVLDGHSGGDHRRIFLPLELDRIPRKWQALGLVATSERSSLCLGIATHLHRTPASSR